MLTRRDSAARLALSQTLLALGLLVLNLPARGEAAAPGGLTAVSGIKVGHHTLAERPTGCTVVLVEEGAVAGVAVLGPAPGTRETALLDPVSTVQEVHAVVLSGGSAFGLDAASGVVRYLEERRVGFETSVARVPIVPAAVLYDLVVGGKPRVHPGPECGYRAAKGATTGHPAEGNVGAGAGATVGKLRGSEWGMKGGIGSAAITLDDGLVVAALVAVNAVGDVIDPATGNVVAGARLDDGKTLADARRLLRQGMNLQASFGENTSLGVVATNARLTQAQANQVARSAHAGLARTIYPVRTPADGDTVFVLATGGHASGNRLQLGALAAEVVAQAVLRAVQMAESVAGYPAARDIPDQP